MKPLRCVVVLVAVLGSAANSTAGPLTWSALLNSAQENNPANTSTATGFGTVAFDPLTNILELELVWSGLTGPGNQAHIHCCIAPTGNAGIAIDLWLVGNPQPATGGFALTFDLDVDNPFRATFMPGSTVLQKFAALQAAMDAPFNAYYNIHTTLWPGGEIRGNLAPLAVPEPSMLLLVAAGAAGALRRRRRHGVAR
jgi:hypothetical protein